MKENSPSGHRVAPPANRVNQSQPSFQEDETDWDFGVGDLIIDLDADLEKTSPQKTPSPKMSGNNMEHHATVDGSKGLKMKIKRKNMNQKTPDPKHELVKPEHKFGLSGTESSNTMGNSPGKHGLGLFGTTGANNINSPDKLKHSPVSDKFKPRGTSNKKDKSKEKNNAHVSNGNPFLMPTTTLTNSDGISAGLNTDSILPFGIKSGVANDPYEFNAKDEDRSMTTFPMKNNRKSEKSESEGVSPQGQGATPATPQTSTPQSTPVPQPPADTKKDVAVETSSIATATDPDCFGPCEPGTSVTLDGIVWNETENGMLVVNVTWRGKTYVGTLLDATKHDWAPPRFSCDSPSSDLEARPANRRGGKRGRTVSSNNDVPPADGPQSRKLRKGRRGTANSANSGNFQAPPSPAKSDVSAPSSGVKRKGRPADIDLSNSAEDGKLFKRSRSNSRGTPSSATAPPEPSPGPGGLIECPEKNCNKKYKHINGLRYHQTHAHLNSTAATEVETEDKGDDERVPTPSPQPSPQPKSTTTTSSSNKTPTSAAKTVQKSETQEKKSETTTVTSQSQSTPGSATTGKPNQDTNSANTSMSNNKNASNKGPSSAKVANKSSVSPIQGKQESKTVVTTSSSHGNSQMYHISGSTVLNNGVIGSVTTPASQHTGTKVVTATLANIPVADTIAITSTENKKSKTDKDKSKLKNNQGRSVAPSHTTVTQSNTTPAMSHKQVSPPLKPIQPRQANDSAVNPAIAAIKDRKPKAKKSKKERDQSGSPKLETAADLSKSSQVIKSAPPAKLPHSNSPRQPPPPLIKKEKVDSNLNSAPVQGRLGTMRVNSPLNVQTERDHTEDNVQSPAYSDISDAADSTPPLDTESVVKKLEETVKGEANKANAEHRPEHNIPGGYSVYPPYYNNQTPYMIPGLSGNNTPQSSPSLPPMTPPIQSAQPAQATPNVTPQPQSQADSVKKPPVESRPSSSNSIPSEAKPKVEEATNGDKGDKKLEDVGHERLSELQQQQQQMMLQQQYAQVQYQQYLTAYGLVDPAYMQMIASDPRYKEQHEKLMEEHEKRRKELARQQGADPSANPNPNQTPNKMEPRSESRGPPNKPSSSTSRLTPTRDLPTDLRQDPAKSNMDKEKRQENHQIMKESIELKKQMDPKAEHRELADVRNRQQKELERFYMYQQHQASARRDLDQKDLGNLGKPSTQSGPVERRHVEVKQEKPEAKPSAPTRDQRMENIKREEKGGPEHRLSTEKPQQHSRPSSRDRERPRHDDRNSSPVDLGKGGKEGQVPMGYPYMSPAAYPYGPLYGGMGGPAVIGYSGHPSYIHPAQMRYQLPGGPGHNEKDIAREKATAPGPPREAATPPRKTESPKALDLFKQRASHYYNSPHKIHELEQQGHPRSTAPQTAPKSTTPTSLNSSTSESGAKTPREYQNSPPTQRHLHQHHHIHQIGGYPPPMYDHYGALITPSTAVASAIPGGPNLPPTAAIPPTAAPPHPFIPK
ncbi:unnamed protein product [Owenia fusiformis]|uniref:Uncharacterized protein n=1 Tax=Owenia fusiformis TaxID=6347 RepID=A0A8J1TYJ3_OWEFU|nr:unnamed protein product [Owenia fusiformis]